MMEQIHFGMTEIRLKRFDQYLCLSQKRRRPFRGRA